MKQLYWMHEEALRLDHPAALQAGNDAHMFFIWDDDYLQRMDYGFHRLHFIYEALCALNIPIYKGNIHEVIIELKHMQHSTILWCADTPNPALRGIIDGLQTEITLIRTPDTAFVTLSKAPDLHRFFRYWNKAEKLALQHNGGA